MQTPICKIAFLSMAKVLEIYAFYVFNDSFSFICLLLICNNCCILWSGILLDFPIPECRLQTLICIPNGLFTLTVITKISKSNQFKAKVTKIMLMPIFVCVSFCPFMRRTAYSIQENACCRNRTWTSIPNLNRIACIQIYVFRSRRIHYWKKRTQTQLKFIENCLLINIKIQNNNFTWFQCLFACSMEKRQPSIAISTERKRRTVVIWFVVLPWILIYWSSNTSICFVASKI